MVALGQVTIWNRKYIPALGMHKLKSIGLSDGLLEKIKNLSLHASPNLAASKSSRIDSYEEPDFVEWSILSGLCLMNNEAMFSENVLPIERNTIERLQVKLNFFKQPKLMDIALFRNRC